jgi:dienelactone hydrolase
LIGAAAKGDFDLASRDFDDQVKQGLPPSAFAATWKGIEAQVGTLTSITSVAFTNDAEHPYDDVLCAFERASLLVRVAFDADGRIAGLHFRPAPPSETSWTPPPYAKPDAIDERPVSVGTEYPLPGVLTLPRGATAAPVVILVHGSGPNDADETVGGAKVFKDLAWGLASRGVAVLRYVNRARQHPASVVTTKDEVLDDVRAAVDLARHSAGVDPRRVFVLGHSLGGYLAPRIARENPGLAGVVILAGPTRPLEDVVIDQITYLSSLSKDASASTAARGALAAARASKVAIEDPALKPSDDVSFVGVPMKGAYFLDLRGYDPAAVAKGLDCPLLVLQGGRDYQVTRKDFDGWHAALGDRPRATLKLYPSLNHLFVEGVLGQRAPSPAEYASAGHVDGAVIEDVAAWVTRAR